MKIRSLFITAILIVAIFCFGGLVKAADNSALIAQIMAQIQALQAQLKSLQAQQGSSNPTNSTWCHTFNINLKFGDTNQTTNYELGYLETALTKEGLINGNYGVQDSFDETIASAVIAFQAKYGILKTGYVGPLTRAKLNSLYGCATTPVPTSTTTSPTACSPNWQCTSWSVCLNNQQTKTCIDSNNCGTTIGKPTTTQSCVSSINNVVPIIPSASSSTLSNLNVSLDPSTPSAGSLGSSSTGKDLPFTKIKISAGGSAVIIDSMTLAMKYENIAGIYIGTGGKAPLYSNYFVQNIKVFNGTTQVGQTISRMGANGSDVVSLDVSNRLVSNITGNIAKETIAGTYYYSTISPHITIPANGSKILTITGLVSQFSTGQIPIQLGVSDIKANVTTSGIPVYGSKMTIAPTTPTISVATGSSSLIKQDRRWAGTGTPTDAQAAALSTTGTFASFRIYNNDTFNIVNLSRLKFKITGTVPYDLLQSLDYKITDSSGKDARLGHTTPVDVKFDASTGYYTLTSPNFNSKINPTTTSIASISQSGYVDITLKFGFNSAGSVAGKTLGANIESASDIVSEATVQSVNFPLVGTLLNLKLESQTQ